MRIVLLGSKTRGFIEGKINAYTFDTLRRIPGRSKWVDKTFWFEKTIANLSFLKEKFPDAEWLDENNRLGKIDELEQLHKDSEEVKSGKKIEIADYTFKTEPFEHQRKAFYLSRNRKAFAILFEQGTGKTKVAIDTTAWLYLCNLIDVCLIIAPNNVHRQWVKEQFPIHLMSSIKCKAMIWSPGRKIPVEMKVPCKELRVIAVNIEALSDEDKIADFRDFLTSGRSLIILDESSRIKNYTAKRTKNILKLGKYADYKRILSGTPITTGLENLYTQFSFLDPDILGFSSFFSFRNRYCETRPLDTESTDDSGNKTKGRIRIVGYKNVEELQQKVEAHSFRVTKSECIDLPDKIYVEREVPLTKEQKKHYKSLKEELFTILDDATMIEVRIALTALIKLQQVVCGFLKDDTGKITDLASDRVEVCLDIAEEAPRKGIIWSRFSHNIDQIHMGLARRGIKAIKYDGRTADKAGAIDRFTHDEECKWLIANQAAGGIGLNLAFTDTVIYFSNSFSGEIRWQSEDRSHRLGQKHNVTYYDMIAPNTVDRKILSTLKARKDLALNVLDLRRLLIEEDEET